MDSTYLARVAWPLLALIGLLLPGLARADVVTYYHTDGLGTPVMESNATGQVTYKREHRPYGEQQLGAAKHGPGFTGHVGDADTGLTYMQARYFDPIASRFLSNDPVAASLGTGANFNRYWYANNNPYRFVDPDGKKAWTGHLCDIGGCEMGSFIAGDSTPAASFGEPADATGGFRVRNSAWIRAIRSSCSSETTCAVTGTIKVSSADSQFSAQEIAEILQASYNGIYQHVVSSVKTITYTVSIMFKAVEKGGDLVIKSMTNRQLAWARAKHQPIFGVMWFNTNTMYLNRTKWNDVSGIVPHEFGHGLGLEHESNSVDSIMNYNFGSNNVSPKDISLIAGGYR